MNRVDSGNIHRMEYVEDKGCFGSLLGLFALSMGAAGIYGAFANSFKTRSGAPLGFVVPFVIGVIFCLAGFVIAVGRRGKIFDKSTQTVTSWWGIFSFPLHHKTYPLAGVASVNIRHELRKIRRCTCTVYPVTLDGGSRTFNICTPYDEMEARRIAAEIAQFLNVTLRNSITGEIIERRMEASGLDGSVDA